MILKRDFPCIWQKAKPNYRTWSRYNKDSSKYELIGDAKITFPVVITLWVSGIAL